MVINTYSIFDFIVALMVPISFLVNKTLYTKVKNEEHREKGKIVQQIIKTYALVQCVSSPCISIFNAILHLSIVTLESIEITTARYLIAAFRFGISFYISFVSLHSLIIAICRYAFLVFDSHTERFGVQRLRKVLILSCICVPLLTTILYEATYSNEKVFLFRYLHDCESSQIPSVNGSVKVNENYVSNEYESPIYLMVNENFPKPLIYGINILFWVLSFTIYSNVFEGFIYIHTFIAMKRY